MLDSNVGLIYHRGKKEREREGGCGMIVERYVKYIYIFFFGEKKKKKKKRAKSRAKPIDWTSPFLFTRAFR